MKINTRSQQWYGWLRDLPDHRDLMYSAIKPALAALPSKVHRHRSLLKMKGNL